MKRYEQQGYKLFWGDPHRQTATTCGEGTIRENFTVCREEFHMDFCAITDNTFIAEDPANRLLPGPILQNHRHFRNGKQAHSVPPGYWEELTREVARAHRPGEFVPFLAYEWCSARWGDRNVYYPGGEGPLYTPGDVCALLDGARLNGAMVMPHHVGYAPGRRGTDWGAHDPRVERLAEIYSTHQGCSELEEGNRFPLWNNSMGGNAPGNSVTSALLRGIRIGFNAGTDSHQLRQKPGLTGVWAKDGTRESLWEGFWARRTVADTGARIAVLLTVEGVMQGSAVVTDRLPQISIRVEAADRLVRVELLRQGRVVRTWHPIGSEFAADFAEADEPAGPDTWYYVRVTGKSGEMAWSSPVWVSYFPDAPFACDRLYWLNRPLVQWAVTPEGAGFRSRLAHLGCERDGAVSAGDLTVRPQEAVEFMTSGSEPPYRLMLKDSRGEVWNLVRHKPTGLDAGA